ncbi:hypothetical protein Q5752_002506 [Cryptotrichosporon argae]
MEDDGEQTSPATITVEAAEVAPVSCGDEPAPPPLTTGVHTCPAPEKDADTAIEAARPDAETETPATLSDGTDAKVDGGERDELATNYACRNCTLALWKKAAIAQWSPRAAPAVSGAAILSLRAADPANFCGRFVSAFWPQLSPAFLKSLPPLSGVVYVPYARCGTSPSPSSVASVSIALEQERGSGLMWATLSAALDAGAPITFVRPLVVKLMVAFVKDFRRRGWQTMGVYDELRVYTKLAELQGGVLPKLVGWYYGLVPECVFTSLVLHAFVLEDVGPRLVPTPRAIVGLYYARTAVRPHRSVQWPDIWQRLSYPLANLTITGFDVVVPSTPASPLPSPAPYDAKADTDEPGAPASSLTPAVALAEDGAKVAADPHEVAEVTPASPCLLGAEAGEADSVEQATSASPVVPDSASTGHTGNNINTADDAPADAPPPARNVNNRSQADTDSLAASTLVGPASTTSAETQPVASGPPATGMPPAGLCAKQDTVATVQAEGSSAVADAEDGSDATSTAPAVEGQDSKGVDSGATSFEDGAKPDTDGIHRAGLWLDDVLARTLEPLVGLVYVPHASGTKSAKVNLELTAYRGWGRAWSAFSAMLRPSSTIAPSAVHELKVYFKLAELQGGALPKLVGWFCGPIPARPQREREMLHVFVLEDAGEPVCSAGYSVPNSIPRRFSYRNCAAYDAVRAAGVTHGSAKLRDIRQPPGAPGRVVFIDSKCANRKAPPAQRALEAEDVRELLGAW